MEPLTIDQLKSLGFDIAYKKRKGVQVFACACHLDYDCDYLIGDFYSLPTFKELIQRVEDKATEREKSRIKEKLAQQMLD